MSFLFRSIIYLFVILLFTSCSLKKNNKWSILVIGVENLDFEDLSCNRIMDSNLAGFKSLCEDAVYFTHAYIASTFTPSNIATVLTGQYPFEHKLRSPDSFLSEKSETLAELLVKKGFKTSFFSSGGSVFRKKGIDQGFEVFDDKIKISRKKIYRSASELTQLYKKWMNKQGSKKTFSFLHYSDPMFLNTKVSNDKGNEQSSTRNNQVEELSKSVEELIYYLKKNKKWDHTMLVFMGLNGVSKKETVAKFDNLFSENTHVPLLVKPPKKKRDLGISWAIDKNISIVDIGVLLRNYFNIKLNPSVVLKQNVDLRKSLTVPISNWSKYREIITESTWFNKKGGVVSKVALRYGSTLYLHKKSPELYNSLIDRQEIINVEIDNYLYKKIEEKLKVNKLLPSTLWEDYANEKTLSDFVSQFWIDKSEIDLWPIEFLIEESKTNISFYELLVDWLLKNKKWNQLDKLQKIKADGDLQYVLSKHISNYNINLRKSICLSSFIDGDKNIFMKNCKDDLSLRLWSWQSELKQKDKNKKMRSFLRLYKFRLISKKIEIYNIANGFSWFQPNQNFIRNSWVDKIMYLPEYKSLFKEIKKIKY